MQFILFYKWILPISRSLSGKNKSACQVGDANLIPGLERPPGRGNGNPIQ